MKKRDKGYTIFIVSDADSKPYSFRLPVFIVPLLIILTVIAAGAVLVFSRSYMQMAAENERLAHLRQVNLEQKQTISVLKGETAAMEERLAELNELDQQLRDILGLAAPADEEAPVAAAEAETEGPEVAASAGDIDNTGRIAGRSAAVPGQEQRAAALSEENNAPFSTAAASVYADPAVQDARELENELPEMISEADTRADSLSSLVTEAEDYVAELAATPMGWPVGAGRITSTYGWRTSPTTFSREFHEGIDIGARFGQPVYATAEGVVTDARYRQGYGLYVRIRGRFGYDTVFAHNSRLAVSAGDRVSRGDLIAFVGCSGRCTGAHVHYEVWRYGELVNPYRYLATNVDIRPDGDEGDR